MLDPGHGGFDPGAVANGLREADLTLQIATKTGINLQRCGFQVLYTRQGDQTATNNTTDELNYRCSLANNNMVDLYVSFHINAGGGSGFESYIYPGVGGVTALLQQDIHKNVAPLFTGNGMPDRGMKTSTNKVLQGTKMPAIMLFLGFIDNIKDVSFIRNAIFQDQIAEQVARGVCHWEGVPFVPSPETSIMGTTVATEAQMTGYIKSVNPNFPATLTPIYLEIGKKYGIRADIAFVQMIIETGFFRFGGIIKPSQNNFAGLGAADGSSGGASFPTPRAGVIAHIQHLYAYSSTAPLPAGETLIDPIFKFITRGSATTWISLNGKWAVPGTTYGQDILRIYNNLMHF